MRCFRGALARRGGLLAMAMAMAMAMKRWLIPRRKARLGNGERGRLIQAWVLRLLLLLQLQPQPAPQAEKRSAGWAVCAAL